MFEGTVLKYFGDFVQIREIADILTNIFSLLFDNDKYSFYICGACEVARNIYVRT